MADEKDDGIYLTIEVIGSQKVDLDANMSLTVEELAEALRAAGVNRVRCTDANNSGSRAVIELTASYQDEPPPGAIPIEM